MPSNRWLFEGGERGGGGEGGVLVGWDGGVQMLVFGLNFVTLSVVR